MRTMARTRSSSVESDRASTPARLNAPITVRLAPLRRLLEAASESGVVRVDVELLAGLGVLHDQRADVGQLDLARVEQANGDDFVPPVEQAQRPVPARGADEVRDDEDERASLDRVRPGLEQRRQIGERRAAPGADDAGSSSIRWRTWSRPPRAGIVRSTALP